MSSINEAERKIFAALAEYGYDTGVIIPALLGATSFYLTHLFKPESRDRMVFLAQEAIPLLVDEEAALPIPMLH